MNQKLRMGGSRVAFVAALVLVVQTFLSAWATASMAATPTLDAFGNPICVTGSDEGGAPARDHASVHDCCTFGCSTVSTVLAVPDFDAASLARPLLHPRVLFQTDGDVVIAAPDHDPGSPRAPPLTL